jgi:hypothetical protein
MQNPRLTFFKTKISQIFAVVVGHQAEADVHAKTWPAVWLQNPGRLEVFISLLFQFLNQY